MSSAAKAFLSDYKSGIQSYEDAAKLAMRMLLDGIDYRPPNSDQERIGSLASALHSDFYMDEYDPAWFETTCCLSAMVAENYYQPHSYDVQLQIARFVWLTICMDDLGHKFPTPMEKLQFSILSSEKVESPVLSKLRTILCDMYLFWDSISANCIASSTMEYINGWLLELQIVPKIKISMSAESWPYFLRAKTGAPAAYGFMIFPQDPAYEVADFIQAMEDIMIYISLANDVLSFYKEVMENDTINYIHNRALVSGKSINDTLIDVSRDTVAAYSRACKVLQSQSPSVYQLWKTFAHGYVAWHLNAPRYRLRELGILVQ